MPPKAKVADVWEAARPHMIAQAELVGTYARGQQPQAEGDGAGKATGGGGRSRRVPRSEEHTSELQSLMRISYAVFCLKKKKDTSNNIQTAKKDTTQKRAKISKQSYDNIYK